MPAKAAGGCFRRGAVQPCQAAPKRPLIAAAQVKPGEQKHRAMGQLRDGSRTRHHQQLRIGEIMQGLQCFRLDTEQGHGLRSTAFGKQALTAFQRQAPGLMNTSTTDRLNGLQGLARQRPVGSHQIVPQT